MDPCNYCWMTTHHILINDPVFLRQTLTKYADVFMNIQIMLNITVLINSREMLLSEFPQALDINPCPSTIVCNTCEVMNVSGDILNDDKNVEDKYEYEFTGSFFK